MESPPGPHHVRVAQRFPAVIDPVMNKSHRVEYALTKQPERGAPIDVIVEFRQGYVDEAHLGDLLISWSHISIGRERKFNRAIPVRVAKDITDYGDLWLCMVANQRPRGSKAPEN